MNITITVTLLEDSSGAVLSDVATLTAGNGCMKMYFTNPDRHVVVKMSELKMAMQILLSQSQGE